MLDAAIGSPLSMRVLGHPAYRFRADNPYNALLYEAIERTGANVQDFTPLRALTQSWDIWHLHWPEYSMSKGYLLGSIARSWVMLRLLDLQRRRGCRIVWTVHNLAAHENPHPRAEAWFWREFTSRVDGLIALTKAGEVAARSRYPNLARAQSAVIPHGHYRGAYGSTSTRESSRSKLGIDRDAFVLLYFGHIRPYKNVPHLIRVFSELRNPTYRLLVAGNPGLDSERVKVEREAGRDHRVVLRLGRVPDADVRFYLGAANLVVLPFTEVLNSGSALLALSYERPVLTPRIGALPELQDHVGSSWVRTYEGELNARILTEATVWAGHDREAAPRLDDFDWREIGQRTASFFEAL